MGKYPVMYDPVLDESQQLNVSRYLSACLLRELQYALQLIGVHSRCEPGGHDDIVVPQLYLKHSTLGWLPMPLVALPEMTDGDAPVWCFKPVSGEFSYPATNMPAAARMIANDLSEQS